MSFKALIADASIDTLNAYRWAIPDHFQIFVAQTESEIESVLNQSIPDIIIANIQLFHPKSPAYTSYLNHPNKKNIKVLLTVPKSHFSSVEDPLTHHKTNHILLPIIHQELTLRIQQLLQDNSLKIMGLGLCDETTQEINTMIQTHNMKIMSHSTATPAIIEPYDAVLVSGKTFENSHPNETPLFKLLNETSRPCIALLQPNIPFTKHTQLINLCQDFIFAPLDPLDLKIRIKRLQQNTTPDNNPTLETPPPFSIRRSAEKPSISLLNDVQNTMNHEIKNPLTNIVAGAQTLKARNNSLSLTDQKLIEEIERSAHRIKLVVDNIHSVHTSGPFDQQIEQVYRRRTHDYNDQ